MVVYRYELLVQLLVRYDQKPSKGIAWVSELERDVDENHELVF